MLIETTLLWEGKVSMGLRYLLFYSRCEPKINEGESGSSVIELAFPGFKEKFQWREIAGSMSAYFTCSARARIPAANGAEAEVPVWLVVQVFFRSVVAYKAQTQMKANKLFCALLKTDLVSFIYGAFKFVRFRRDVKDRR